MPYTAFAHDPTTGQAIPASWGDQVVDNVDYLATDHPHCIIFESTPQTVTTGTTGEALTSNEETSDIGGMHSTVSNTELITIPSGEGGLYTISATVTYAANATGIRQLVLEFNATTQVTLQKVDACSSGSTVLNGNITRNMAAGDTVSVWAIQTSGGDLGCTMTDFSVRWVATA